MFMHNLGNVHAAAQNRQLFIMYPTVVDAYPTVVRLVELTISE